MISFKKTEKREVENAEMQRVYNLIKTPVKVGAILKFEEDLCDSPSVFRHGDKWYMSFIKIGKDTANSGYDSHLAESEDLVHWNYLGKTLTRTEGNAWDSKQIALYAGFVQNELNGEYRLNKVNGKYYFPYLGGNLNGYETDPLTMGLAYTETPEEISSYKKFPEPFLRPTDADARKGETLTLYKSNFFIDSAKTTGYPYVNAYNAKAENHKESIFLAVSKGGERWERYGETAIVKDETPDQSKQIIGDPVILKDGNLYVMIYFVLQNGKTYNTFACSYDLITWTHWDGEPLIKSEYEWENVYAHKTAFVRANGVSYHYYCAVNDKGERFIALAKSEKEEL